MQKELRKTGSDVIGSVPWATHFCQFYQTKQDLLDILVPYFKAGLENNEFCMWITAEPLGVEGAKEAMARALPDFDRYLAKGQMEIMPHTDWYLKGGAFESQRVLNGWVDKLEQALASGYAGLRLTGNTFWLEKKDWKSFADYEAAVNSVIGKCNMLALCTYCLDRCSAAEIIDVIRNHQFALIKREGKWELIESSIYKQTEEALKESQRDLSHAQAVARIGSWRLDIHRNELLWSEETCRLFGIPQGTPMTYGKFLATVHPEDRQYVDQKWTAALRGEDYDIEHRIVVGSEVKWVREKAELEFEQGVLKGGFGTVQDITEQKRAEEALRESQGELATILASVPILTLAVDPDRRVLKANDAAAKFAGRSPEEMAGLPGGEALRCLHSMDDPSGCGFGPSCQTCKVRLSVLDTFETGNSHYQVEWHLPLFRAGKQEEITFLLSTVPIATPKKQVLVCIEDITERKQAESRLEYLASFPQMNPNPVTEMDLSGHITFANPAAKNLFPTLLQDEGQHPYFAGWETIVRELEKSGAQSINREINLNDSYYVQTVQYLRDEGLARVYGRDITERKQAEEALQQTRDYLNNLLDYANAPIIVWDPQFRITRFNRAFERLTGLRASEVLGRQLDILFPEDSRDESLGHIREAAAGERWETVEIPILRQDGSVRTVLWNSATLYGTDGKTVVATIAQGQDITERKQAEEQLKQRTLELEAANKELESFSYSVSHDLRAPLRSMDGFSQALLEDYSGKLDDEGRDYLKRIQDSASNMAQLIDDMLELSRLTRVSMRRESVNLSELAESITAELKKTQPKRHVEVSIAPGLVVYGDAKLFRVVLENLLDNAWKFTAKTPQARIEMGITEHDGGEAYFVRDNGPGFDMAYADKLFVPFQRLHKTTEFPGTGIGLATVKRIIHRHGGQVWGEGKVGKGATFYFILP